MTPTSDLAASDRAKQLTDALHELYKLIPELRDSRMIKLTQRHFEFMPDVVFITLYDLIASPDTKLDVVVAPKTWEYIDKRRRELGLNKAPVREITKEEARSPFKRTMN